MKKADKRHGAKKTGGSGKVGGLTLIERERRLLAEADPFGQRPPSLPAPMPLPEIAPTSESSAAPVEEAPPASKLRALRFAPWSYVDCVHFGSGAERSGNSEPAGGDDVLCHEALALHSGSARSSTSATPMRRLGYRRQRRALRAASGPTPAERRAALGFAPRRGRSPGQLHQTRRRTTSDPPEEV